jgi:hypothetical protein
VLSASDERVLDERLSSSDHDHFVWTGLLGEPALCEGILTYFDAETLTVVGVPLSGEAVESETWQRQLRAAITGWIHSAAVRFVSYWGSYRVPDTVLPGWSSVFAEPPMERNVDIFLDLERSAAGLERTKARENLRRAARSALTLWVGRRPSLSWEHLALLRSLAARDSFGVQDVNCLTNVVSILRSEATTVFEARHEGRLVGFCVAHRYFSTTAFATVAAFDHQHTGCADLIFSAMITYYAGLGARRLGLGYAYDEGSYRFKTKWGGAIVGRPFYELIWQRPCSRREFNGCLHWPWRLLSGQLACGGWCDDLELSATPASADSLRSGCVNR